MIEVYVYDEFWRLCNARVFFYDPVVPAKNETQ
jgi:hypothetical protein